MFSNWQDHAGTAHPLGQWVGYSAGASGYPHYPSMDVYSYGGSSWSYPGPFSSYFRRSPPDTLPCDGQAVPRAVNATLPAAQLPVETGSGETMVQPSVDAFLPRHLVVELPNPSAQPDQASLQLLAYGPSVSTTPFSTPRIKDQNSPLHSLGDDEAGWPKSPSHPSGGACGDCLQNYGSHPHSDNTADRGSASYRARRQFARRKSGAQQRRKKGSTGLTPAGLAVP